MERMQSTTPTQPASSYHSDSKQHCKQTHKAVSKALSKRGYTPDNTLFGHSTCPDEINQAEGQVVSLFKKRWGEAFSVSTVPPPQPHAARSPDLYLP